MAQRYTAPPRTRTGSNGNGTKRGAQAAVRDAVANVDAGVVAGKLLDNVETVVRGKRREVSQVVAALATGGHVLIEDVPGTAKTVLARAIAQSIKGASVGRIQRTPDLQPSDVTALSIYNQKTRDFEFRPGPVFANVVLLDEVN